MHSSPVTHQRQRPGARSPRVAGSAKIVRSATLKVYEGARHRMCTTLKDWVNAELEAFIKD
jgi:hypothetical protein